MPSDRAPVVAAAIATARIFVVKTPGPATEEAAPPPAGPDGTADPSPPGASEPGPSQSGTTQPDVGQGGEDVKTRLVTAGVGAAWEAALVQA